MESKARPVILYDAFCSDGFGGAFAAWKKFGDRGTYIPLRRDEPIPDEVDGADVYFIDFVYDIKDSKLDEVIRRAHRTILIDHHQTAKNHDGGKFDDMVLDMEHSGATLAWRYFHQGTEPPRLLQYIEHIDLGRFDEPGAKEVDAVLGLHDYDFGVWDTLAVEFEDDNMHKRYLRDGAMLLRAEEKLINRLVKHAEEVEFEGHKTLMVNSPTKVSYIGRKLYEKLPPMGIVWSRRGKKVIVSLRSNGDVDVSKIAEKYGGGGHPQSAAFAWTAEEFLRLTPEKLSLKAVLSKIKPF